MADSNFSPEKELLKLIEKPGTESALPAAAPASQIKRQSMNIVSPAAVKSKANFLQKKFKNFSFSSIHQLDMKSLNFFLELGIAVMLIYFAAHLTFSFRQLNRPLDLKLKVDKLSDSKSVTISSILRDASYYLDRARARDLFKMNQKEVVVEDVNKGISKKIAELIDGLKLVGISWSRDPDVMIEDTKNKRTLFLKKGQSIDGEVKVEDVFKDKVILTCEGRQIELK